MSGQFPNIVYLNRPVKEPITLDALYEADTEMYFQTNGKPLGIVKFMEELALNITSGWEEVLKPYFLSNLTGTQYIYKSPIEVSPFEIDINRKWEDSTNYNPDSPWNSIPGVIVFDVIRDAGASLTRVAWGGRKELTPRLRMYVNANDKIYPLYAQRKEYLLDFKCYSHTSKESILIKEGLHKWFQVKQEVLYSLGAQKFFVDISNAGTVVDQRTRMYGRTLRLYLRLEDWYLGKESSPIKKVSIEWVPLNGGSIPSIGDSEVI